MGIHISTDSIRDVLPEELENGYNICRQLRAGCLLKSKAKRQMMRR